MRLVCKPHILYIRTSYDKIKNILHINVCVLIFPKKKINPKVEILFNTCYSVLTEL